MKQPNPDIRHRISTASCLGRRLVLSGIILALFNACAPPPVYTVRLNLPLVPADLPPSALVVGVVDFEDARTVDIREEKAYRGRRIGQREDQDGNLQDIVLNEESLSGTVTTIFQSILRKNNFIVSTIPAWRPAPDGSPSVPSTVDAVISARIEEFSVAVDSRTLKTEISYGLRFSAEIGVKGKDRVTIHTVKLEPRLTRPGFSQKTVERNLNTYLAEALERLADDLLALQTN